MIKGTAAVYIGYDHAMYSTYSVQDRSRVYFYAWVHVEAMPNATNWLSCLYANEVIYVDEILYNNREGRVEWCDCSKRMLLILMQLWK